MSDEPDILMRKGKPWFSIGVLTGVATLAASGVAIFLTMKQGQKEIGDRLSTNETAVVKAASTLDSMATDIRALRLDVNSALLDRWTGTDMKFYGLDMARFWSDLARLNPTLVVPAWPAPKRVTDNDSGH